MLERKVIWNKNATEQLELITNFIRLQSNQNADNFKTAILAKIDNLSDDTHVHRVDPLKKNNDGNFLYLEVLKVRISYYATPNEVIVIRVRHTKQKPKKY